VNPDPHAITTLAQLEAMLPTPSEASLVKEIDHITAGYRAMIEASPFCALATTGPDGLDVSPRGDPKGFVTIEGDRTLVIPDRRGNNRADSLRNIVVDDRVALLFLIPGLGETLRVQGRARLTTDPVLCARHAMGEAVPRLCIVIAVERIYFQCARAIARSGLWDPARHVARASVPSPGSIMAEITKGGFDGVAYDAALPARQAATLY